MAKTWHKTRDKDQWYREDSKALVNLKIPEFGQKPYWYVTVRGHGMLMSKRKPQLLRFTTPEAAIKRADKFIEEN